MSRILRDVHRSAERIHCSGYMTGAAMREFDTLCRPSLLTRFAFLLLAALPLAACNSGGSSTPTVVVVAPPGLQSTAVAWKLPTPAGWQQLFGAGTELKVTGNTFTFSVPTNPNHVNYVVNSPVAPLSTAKNVTFTFNITQSSNAAYTYKFDTSNTCGGPPRLTPYFQQKGDNGQEDTYRWWANAYRLAFQPGKQSVVVPFDPNKWGSVFGHTANTVLAGWNAALANPIAIGLTFGGGCFDGHGLAMTAGSATFSLTSFSIN